MRSAHLQHYPIIQTNAAVEAHWSVLKYRGLKWFHQPRIDHLCATLHEQLLPIFVISINQIRNKLKPGGWYKQMITEWRKLLETVKAEDLADEEEMGGMAARVNRMHELHHTDMDTWTCTCGSFMISPYHICKHLVRLYGTTYPYKGECARQRTPPLLFLNDIHSIDVREVVQNPIHYTPREAYTSLEEIGVSQRDLELLESSFPQQTGDEDDPRSGDIARIKEIEDFNNQLRLIIEYNEEVIQGHHPSHRHYRELPRPNLSQVSKYYKIALGAKKLDRRRSQVGTFARERAGNIFRDT